MPTPTAQTQMKPPASCQEARSRNRARRDILKDGSRIDGRTLDQVRPIVGDGRLPAAHPRLGAVHPRRDPGDLHHHAGHRRRRADDRRAGRHLQEAFMLHYNFPPYSVGEVGPLRRAGPPRDRPRQARLARAAPGAAAPRKTSPTPSACVSDITESNGSSSMATVCGGSLSLMDAGVPSEAPVSGIAMGLILEGDDFAVLSDILGDEDHLGDMDFKVAGTDDGITVAADGHQDRRHHPGDHGQGAGAGQGRPRAYPGRDGQGARRRPCRSLAHAPRIETMQIDKSTRSATSSAPAAR